MLAGKLLGYTIQSMNRNIVRAQLAVFSLVVGCICNEASAAPVWSIAAGGGSTNMKWQAFNQTVGHYELGVGAEINSWLGLELTYWKTPKTTGSILPPGQLSFGPNILTVDSSAFQLGAVLRWKATDRFSFFAKPTMAAARVGHVMIGGTAVPSDRSEITWQTSSSVKFIPSVGVSANLGRGVSLSVDARKARLWRLDEEAFTAYLTYRFE